ncbi:MAG TPA: hypothetical protein VN920_16890 [Pyrinomonadaceae bacterium]|nr:hypothetical protein [Pyrinomonadaceae bacterium]
MSTPKRTDQITKLVGTFFLLSVALLQLVLLIVLASSIILSQKDVDWAKTWENWEKASGTVEHVATVVAVIIGGLWAYYKFFRGRVFVPRLDLELSATGFCKNNTTFLVVSLELKNVGLSRVDIHQRGTALRVSANVGNTPITKTDTVSWRRPKAYTIFERHSWIESRESIKDELMIAIPGCNHSAFRLEFRLIGSRNEFVSKTSRITWREVKILEQPSQKVMQTISSASVSGAVF